MFINTVTLQQCTEAEIRASFPNVSFAHPFVAPDGYAVLFQSPKPDYNPVTHTVVEGGPQLTVKGHWEQTWVLQPIYQTPEQEAAALAADAEAKRIAAIPYDVSMRQASLALLNAGLLDDVEALVATLPRAYQIEWERASKVQRDNPLVEIVRQQQGMTTVQIDDLFTLAATL